MSSYLLLVMHYVACVWFYSACSRVISQGQAEHSSPHGNGTSVYQITSVVKQTLYKCGETSWARIMKKSAIAIGRLTPFTRIMFFINTCFSFYKKKFIRK